MHVAEAKSAQAPMEGVPQTEAVQNDGSPVASFITALIAAMHPPELTQAAGLAVVTSHAPLPVLTPTTAYRTPARVAALIDMRTNACMPISVIPSVRIKKIGAKIAASTAAVARVQRRRSLSSFIARA